MRLWMGTLWCFGHRWLIMVGGHKWRPFDCTRRMWGQPGLCSSRDQWPLKLNFSSWVTSVPVFVARSKESLWVFVDLQDLMTHVCAQNKKLKTIVIFCRITHLDKIIWDVCTVQETEAYVYWIQLVIKMFISYSW